MASPGLGLSQAANRAAKKQKQKQSSLFLFILFTLLFEKEYKKTGPTIVREVLRETKEKLSYNAGNIP